MRYSFRQLEYFIAAGETGSITLASERISISQPSISTAIAHLERELGVQLFVRHHAQGLSLTSAGKTLLREAKRIIEQADALHTVASEAAEQIRGQLAVGCLVTLAPMVLPELAQSFTAAFPATHIRPVENNQERLLEGLRRAEIDIAITYDLQIPDGISFTPLASLPAHVLVGEAHPLAQQTAVSLQELAGEPLVLLDLPLSREYFLALFLKEGLEPTIAMRSAYQEVVRTMPGRRASPDADRHRDIGPAQPIAPDPRVRGPLQGLRLGLLYTRHGRPGARSPGAEVLSVELFHQGLRCHQTIALIDPRQQQAQRQGLARLEPGGDPAGTAEVVAGRFDERHHHRLAMGRP